MPEVWRVDYETRAPEAVAWAARHGVGPAGEDSLRRCLLAVDCQNTFCTPGFELFVPGAPEDSRRLCELVYRQLGRLTGIVATLDTHRAFQIFHAAFIVGRDERHPPPYSAVSVADVESGRWRAAEPALEEHLLAYVQVLAERGKYELTVWPYHAMLGSVGHALVSALEEAFFFHALARGTQTRFELKGSETLTEAYSALRARGLRRAESRAGRAPALLRRGLRRGTGEEPLRRVDGGRSPAPRARPRAAALPPRGLHVTGRRRRSRLHPAGRSAFARFAAAGAHVVRSTGPWP